jgi:uncharacterized protein involved in exopolysaccharide biosynthesis
MASQSLFSEVGKGAPITFLFIGITGSSFLKNFYSVRLYNFHISFTIFFVAHYFSCQDPCGLITKAWSFTLKNPGKNVEKEISLLDYLRVLQRRKKTIAFFLLCFFLLAAANFFLTPNMYRAETVILPIESVSGGLGGGASMAAQLIGLPLDGGSASAKKLGVYLKSRNLKKRVSVHLQEDQKKNPQSMLSDLSGSVSVVPDVMSGTLKIVVESLLPETAFRFSQVLLEELQNYINEEEVTSSQRNRIFVGEQLLVNQKELLEIGKELSKYYQRNNVSSVYSVVNVDLHSSPFSGISQDELQLSVDVLKKDKKNLEKSLQNRIVKDVPQQTYLDYLMQKKQILTALDAMLSQQYKAAKIEEQRESVLFQVIDETEKPQAPYLIKKQLESVLIVILGIFLGILYVFVSEFWAEFKAKEV